jgi:predicted GIY-YIG superfamily endonuclease
VTIAGSAEPDAPTALYRFYDKAGGLLYIGISNSVPRRFDQHEDTKPWYTQVRDVKVEHYPSRPAALAAEEKAIKTECPKYNIQHNRRRSASIASAKPTTVVPAIQYGPWTFEARRHGQQRTTDLHLLAELDGSAMVDDYDWLDGEGMLEKYVQYIKRHHSDWLEADAVPILWTVVGRGTSEFAPFQAGKFSVMSATGPHEDFLSYFSWPHDKRGEMLDFFKLPVRIDRFPEFADALDWLPSPLQPTCPLRSILDSRDGVVRRPEGWRPPW